MSSSKLQILLVAATLIATPAFAARTQCFTIDSKLATSAAKGGGELGVVKGDLNGSILLRVLPELGTNGPDSGGFTVSVEYSSNPDPKNQRTLYILLDGKGYDQSPGLKTTRHIAASVTKAWGGGYTSGTGAMSLDGISTPEGGEYSVSGKLCLSP